MKRMAIIPIFIPHKGCPNDCVFCNQKKITARQKPFSAEDVSRRIEEYLPTLENRGLAVIETAFFGGSFTGIPMEEQREYLSIAKKYKDEGRIQRIRLSTRPDYIDHGILSNLKRYGVDTIELGAQSFDEEVLRLSNRGHGAEAIYKSAEKIKEYGFELGIQLMIGLPGDSREKSLYSAGEAVKTGPAAARLYPTVIIKETALYDAYMAGTYLPFSQEEMLEITKDMYLILTRAGIPVIRVGLKSTDLINDKEGSAAVAGTYHPAFRQLVCARIAREELERQLLEQLKGREGGGTAEKAKKAAGSMPQFAGTAATPQSAGTAAMPQSSGTAAMPQFAGTAAMPQSSGKPRLLAVMESCGESFSNMVGNRNANRFYFEEKYPDIRFRFQRNDSLPAETYKGRIVWG